MKVICHLQVPAALSRGKKPLVPIGLEAEWTPTGTRNSSLAARSYNNSATEEVFISPYIQHLFVFYSYF
jgi:hypothetical protein